MKKPFGFSLVVEQKKVPQHEEMSRAAPPQSSAGFYQIITTFILALVFIGLGVFIGYLVWGGKNNKIESKDIDALVTPAQKELQFGDSANSDGWTMYTDIDFSFKYPVTWMIKRGFSAKDDLIVYDPKSIKVSAQNGTQNRIPSVFVDVISVSASTKSASVVATEYIDSMKQKGIDIQSEESPLLKSNMILFDNPERNGKNVVLSRDNMLATFVVSVKNFKENSTENTILQSFQFAPQGKQ